MFASVLDTSLNFFYFYFFIFSISLFFNLFIYLFIYLFIFCSVELNVHANRSIKINSLSFEALLVIGIYWNVDTFPISLLRIFPWRISNTLHRFNIYFSWKYNRYSIAFKETLPGKILPGRRVAPGASFHRRNKFFYSFFL